MPGSLLDDLIHSSKQSCEVNIGFKNLIRPIWLKVAGLIQEPGSSDSGVHAISLAPLLNEAGMPPSERWS